MAHKNYKGDFNVEIMIHSPDGHSHGTFTPEKGGLGTSLIMPDPVNPGLGRELLYAQKGSPFCFPICGRLNRNDKSLYLHQQQQYHMGIHGFAHSLPWEVVSATTSTLVLRLSANDITRAQYPFEFEVLLFYILKNKELVCEQTYTNHGKIPMPYYAGFHPYFWIDPARYQKSQVILNCNALKRIQYNADLTDVLGERPLFPLPIAISEPTLNESLLKLNQDHRVELRFPDQSVISLSAEGVVDKNIFSYLQLYHIAEEPFFCIEHWMAPPNSMNTATNARLIMPGQSEKARFRLALRRCN